MQRSMRILLTGIALAFAGASGGALAQDAEFLGTHRDWHAFQYTENGNKVCYIASKPTAHEEGGRQRGDIFVLVTHRPAEGTRDVVSVVAGYTYEPNSEVSLTIGNNAFQLFTSEQNAWARDSETDRSVVAAMRAGSEMVIRGRSNRGTDTVDTYSLFGFTAAYNTINEACPP